MFCSNVTLDSEFPIKVTLGSREFSIKCDVKNTRKHHKLLNVNGIVYSLAGLFSGLVLLHLVIMA